jgi:hypothetical protein
VRTTIDLDGDLLRAAKQLARERRMTMGQVVSDLMRKGLAPKAPARVRNGFELFTPIEGAPIPDLALINRIRDEEE